MSPLRPYVEWARRTLDDVVAEFVASPQTIPNAVDDASSDPIVLDTHLTAAMPMRGHATLRTLRGVVYGFYLEWSMRARLDPPGRGDFLLYSFLFQNSTRDELAQIELLRNRDTILTHAHARESMQMYLEQPILIPRGDSLQFRMSVGLDSTHRRPRFAAAVELMCENVFRVQTLQLPAQYAAAPAGSVLSLSGSY